ncbi:MAG: hypothetical protein M0R51_16040, partial [Clostridia bacterium]|nr:hypothetical protein [Clostridia bacterium]
MTDDEAQAFLAKAIGSDMVFINQETRKYKEDVRGILEKYFGVLSQPEDKSFENIYEASSIIKALEAAYDSGDAAMINKAQAAMNEIYALQWHVRSKFSGMLTVPMIYNEALAEINNITYDQIKLTGKKLYKDENSSEDDISTIYRGTYSPSEIFMGKAYLFSDERKLHNMERKQLVAMAIKMEMSPEEINKLNDDELRSAIRNDIFQDPNA